MSPLCLGQALRSPVAVAVAAHDYLLSAFSHEIEEMS